MKPQPQNPHVSATTKGTDSVHIGLLGGFFIMPGGDDAVAITNKKNRAILAIVALSPGGQTTRERLCGFLWGDRGEEQARGSLRQSLAVLRKELGEAVSLVLRTRDDVVGLRLETVRVDAVDFLKLADTNDLASLREAAVLFRGELLADTSIRDPGFAEWLSGERRRLMEKAIDVLEKLSALETGPARVEAARRLVDLDPLREASHRALIHAHAEAGETALALQQYESCRAILKAEFGVEPAAETQAVRAAVANGKVNHVQPAAVAISSETGPSTFAGQFPAIPGDKPSIAVLPFANQSGRLDQDYVCDGVTENIITGLGRYHDLFVIDRVSSFAYKGKTVRPQDAAQQLGVRFILNGSVQISGGRIRITVELIEGGNARQLWTNRYDRETNDIFTMQDEVTETIVATLMAGYGGRLRKAWITRPRPAGFERLEAMDYFQRALDAWDFTKLGGGVARGLFHEAVNRDPSFAKAYSKIAWTHMVDASYGLSDNYTASMDKGHEWAIKAVAVDDGDSWANWALAGHHLLNLRHELALEEFQKALNNNPNDAEVMTDYGLCLSYAGRAEQGIDMALKAMRLNPFHHDWYTAQLGQIYFDAHRYDKAISAFASLRSMDSTPVCVYQAASFANLGSMDDARASVRKALELDPAASLEKWGNPHLAPYAKAGDLEHFRAALRKAGLREQPADAPANHDGKPSIAVLPFENLGGDPQQDYFASGITEDIVTELARFRQITVKARTAAARLHGAEFDARKAGTDLGVSYFVSGSVRQIGKRLRISTKLVEAETGNHVWAEHFDRNEEELFDVQDEVVRTIVSTLVGRVEAAITDNAKRKHPGSLAAYEYVLKADALPLYDRQNQAQARAMYEKAIDLDPVYGRPHAMLANLTIIDWMEDMSGSGKALDRALELAKKSVALDENDSTCQMTLGAVYSNLRSFQLAEHHYQRAMELNHSNPLVIATVGTLHLYQGDVLKGMRLLEDARVLDPYFEPSWYWPTLGIGYFAIGKYREAILKLERSPNRPHWVTAYLAACFALLGEEQKAMEALAETLKVLPEFRSDCFASKEWPADFGIRDNLLKGLRKAGLPG